jgi:hypothetical protein
MIPSFTLLSGAVWPVLPPGVHEASIDELFVRYAINPTRISLFNGLKIGLDNIFTSGSRQVFVDGSFVTAKPTPGDYEVCWDPYFVDVNKLDPIFLDFTQGTVPQKLKYSGEFYPSIWIELHSGKPFLEFFQTDKDTGLKKGIVKILNYLN